MTSMSTPEGVDLPEFCCVQSWSAARQAAWKARDLNCGCNPHVEYCDKCIPPVHRPGGAWDKCKPTVPASDRIHSLQAEVERLRELINHIGIDARAQDVLFEWWTAIDDALRSNVAPGGQPSEMSK